MYMKRILSAVLVCMLALTICACGSGSKNGNDSEQSSSVPKNATAETYVSTKTEKKLPFSGDFLIKGEKDIKNKEMPSRLPEIKLDSNDAKRINLDITANFDVELKNMNSKDGKPVDRIDYAAFLNGSLLSVVIERRTVDKAKSDFYIYNLDVITGKQIFEDDVLEQADAKKDDVKTEVSAEIKKKFDELAKKAKTEEQKAKLENSKTDSLSETNLNNVRYYYNGDSHLVAVYRYKGVSGLTDQTSIFDLVVLKVKMKAELSGKKIEVTEPASTAAARVSSNTETDSYDSSYTQDSSDDDDSSRSSSSSSSSSTGRSSYDDDDDDDDDDDTSYTPQPQPQPAESSQSEQSSGGGESSQPEPEPEPEPEPQPGPDPEPEPDPDPGEYSSIVPFEEN